MSTKSAIVGLPARGRRRILHVDVEPRHEGRPRMTWHAVAKVGDLAAGDVLGVELDGKRIVVGRDGDRYFALQRQCVHQGGDLADGIVARGHIICPNHGWRFSTATGRHDTASDVCLVTYAVRVEGGHIEVDPEEPQRGL